MPAPRNAAWSSGAIAPAPPTISPAATRPTSPGRAAWMRAIIASCNARMRAFSPLGGALASRSAGFSA